MASPLACVLDALPLLHNQLLSLGGPLRVDWRAATLGRPRMLSDNQLQAVAAAL